MRSAIGVVCSVAMITAQLPVSLAQNVASTAPQSVPSDSARAVPISPVIVNAFDAFPNGGDQLRKRIAASIVKDPNLAASLVKYLQTTPGLSKEQKLAAERGLADALNQLGIKAAELPVKALPPPAQANPESLLPYLLLAGGIAGIAGICLAACRNSEQVVVSPN